MPALWERRGQRAMGSAVTLLALLIGPALLTCGDTTPTETRQSLTPPATSAPPSSAELANAEDSTLRVQGTVPLPINQPFDGAGPVFRIVHSGPTGANAQFTIGNAANTSAALLGQSNGRGFGVRGLMTGSGRAGVFSVTNTANANNALEASTDGSGAAIVGTSTGSGRVASFAMNNVNNSQNGAVLISTMSAFTEHSALRVVSSGVFAGQPGGGGAAYFENRAENHSANTIEATSLSMGAAGLFTNNGGTLNVRGALEAISNSAGPAGVFRQNGASGAVGIDVSTVGPAPAGQFTVTNSFSPLGAINVTTSADAGWAAIFSSTGAGGGVQITTNGGPGLQVSGGTKNAVVQTSSGARALYTEESAEVWFTDYGFGRLTNRRTHIVIDSMFAETVNLFTPYHVFVQSYGDAELIVTNRTATGFDVVLREGKQRDAEFSYRLVAKRLGFETERLRRAPWADTSESVVRIR